MADLPGIRITEALPFQHSGCDYAGPFILKKRRQRNPRKLRATYASLFASFTSAIQLELATDLSTDIFLACLQRQRTNFVGAKRALDEMQQFLSSQEHQRNLTQSLANDGINGRMQDRHGKYREKETSLGISSTSTYSILLEHLAVKKVCNRWIPHDVTIAQKKPLWVSAKKFWKKTILVFQKKFTRSAQVTIYGSMFMSPK